MPEALTSLLQSSACCRATAPATLRITGPDAPRWLNGMVTAAAQALADGQGAYTFLLNAQGRIVGDGTLFRMGDAFLLRTTPAQIEPLREHLDRFIIMDDVELAVEPAVPEALVLAGPDARERLAECGIAAPGEELRLIASSFDDDSLHVVSDYAPLVPVFRIEAAPDVLDRLEATLLGAGVPQAGDADLHALRLAEGRPLYGVDITARDLPQETAQERALHFSKGCYLGQEIVERIHSRGQVHRALTLFVLDGPLPALPAELRAGDTPAGQLTSAAVVSFPGGAQHLGLAIVRRELIAGAQSLTYRAGDAPCAARAVPAPYRPAEPA